MFSANRMGKYRFLLTCFLPLNSVSLSDSLSVYLHLSVLCVFLSPSLRSPMALSWPTVLHPSSWFNTGTDVVESLRGPLVSLVQQQGLGAAGEDFSNQFYWSYAIGLTQQGQAQSPAALRCKCVSEYSGGICVRFYPKAIAQAAMSFYLSVCFMRAHTCVCWWE